MNDVCDDKCTHAMYTPVEALKLEINSVFSSALSESVHFILK